MPSILNELNNRIKEDPNKLLYAFLDINGNIKESYTYQEFEYRTKKIASEVFHQHTLKKGDRVLLLYPPGLEMICAFFSCVRLGLIPVPVYPPASHGFESSIQKMNYIAQDCEAAAIMTDRSYHWSIQVNLSRKNSTTSITKIKGDTPLIWIITDDFNSSEIKPFEESHSEILFLQYTSGSTSDPKGVMVTHENMISNCNNVVDHMPIGVSWLPQYHDMGLIGYYIFFALKGGTTYGFSPIDFIQRPALWLETITKYSATASSAPNFAYEYCLLPENITDQTFQNLNLSSLRFLMTAAEPINTETYKAFLNKFASRGLKPQSFFAAYGLAEFTLAVSNYGRNTTLFDAQALKENKVLISNTKENSKSLMSCGKPLNDTKIMIVSGESNPEVAQQNMVGEIWLNGSSKCKGYWNKRELTKEVFEARLKLDDEGSWLRTGDIGFIYNNELYICGRTKDLIIIRGSNFYPQDIEKIIEEDSLVRKGCVAAISVEKEDNESLVVIVGVKNNSKIPNAHDISNKISKYIGIQIDKLVFVSARNVLKTSSGKIMRNQNKKLFIENKLPIISEVDLNLTENDPAIIENNRSDSDKDLRLLFKKYGLNGNENNSIGDAGLDSLKLAEFAHDLKVFIKQIGYSELSNEIELRLVQKIAVSELFEIVTDLKHASHYSLFKFKNAFAKLNKEREKIENLLMKKDAESPIDLNLSEITKEFKDQKGSILLTGGTGFFGPFIIKSLLEQNHEDVYVIVRAKNTYEGKKRLSDNFLEIDPSESLKQEFEERIKIICGDISRPKLGVSDAEWAFLENNIETIYNNGALVNYLFDYESMRKTNINSTIEIIKLARSTRKKTLNHISTTFIFGWSVKDTLFESDENEMMENLDFGYSQSKWVSEQLVKKAMKNGLSARIFRPALISPSINGKGYNFDISIRLLAFMINHCIGTNAKNQVSFTPADLGANNIVAICNIKESSGLTFHVTRDTFASMQDITDIIAKLTHKTFTNYSLKDFVPEVVSRCKKDDLLFPLLNFLVRSEQKISAMEFKRYDNDNYKKYRDLSECGLQDTSLESVVRGILLFMKEKNIIDNNI